MSIIRTLRAAGQTLITAGVVILLFCVYSLYFTGIETARAQSSLQLDIRERWDSGRDPAVDDIPIGDGVAVIRIPRFGRDWGRVVVEGVTVAALKKGPGHYPGTAPPGGVGNFVVSGHRTTYGAPFGRLDELVPGDAVVVETRDSWFTYRVASREVVAPTAIDVILPVPHQPGAKPTQRLITLTTCHPKYSARQRLIVYGELESARPKADGPPAALAG